MVSHSFPARRSAVLRAGYPETDTVRVRVVRDGEPIAVIDLIDDGTGKWLVSMVTGCSSLEN